MHSHPTEHPDARLFAAVEGGDIGRARRMLEAALKRDPRNAEARIQLAILLDAGNDRGAAARQLATALRYAPNHSGAAERLGAILAQGRLGPEVGLDVEGLAAALRHRTVDRDLLGAAAIDMLVRQGSLRGALRYAHELGFIDAARHSLTRRSSSVVRDPLLLAVLEHCVVADRDVERFLASCRRVLTLDIAPERFAEPELCAFAGALASQAANNEYVWHATAEEEDWLSANPLAPAAALAGELTPAVGMLKHALYGDISRELPNTIAATDFESIALPPLRKFLGAILAEKLELAAGRNRIAIADDIADRTSLKVQAQYEGNPYPRWRGVALFRRGQYRRYLESFFETAELKFLDAPFETLIAGCGTGCQAVSAALDYGSNAAVTGLDLSLASLSYAAMMASRLEARGLTFVQGDIGKLSERTPPWRHRFKVIECCGVLHHMAKPFDAWRKLLDCLAPDGLMLVGLYSAIARRDLAALRGDPAFPGADCTTAALRAYREALFARPATAPGATFLKSRDAFTTSGFRDFFLHVSEQPTTLAEIARFLDDTGLVFRGFVNQPFARLKARFPEAAWPGRLDQWAALEDEHPSLFIGMYQFWVSRR
ncbi:MAG: methyltransferase domain-containing protein [Proteobacteria bacterium]|nr:methyltransferase domain-containing protein [Pseudomonadota bacterium]